MSNPPGISKEATRGKRRLVHFDLDPHNIFVDKCETVFGEHDITPRLKVRVI
jgi:hypothetical protein